MTRKDEAKISEAAHYRKAAERTPSRSRRRDSYSTPTRSSCATPDSEGSATRPRSDRKYKHSRGSPYSSINKTRSRVSSLRIQTPVEEGSSSPDPKARSALHLAQVDALIKELQRTRGLLDTPSSSGEVSPIRASSVPPGGSRLSTDSKASWLAGHDGILRPDILVEDKVPSTPAPSLQATPTTSTLPPFVPAGMDFLNGLFTGLSTNAVAAAAASGVSNFGTGPRRSLDSRKPREPSRGFPAAFSNYSAERQSTVGRKHSRSRSRQPSGPSVTGLDDEPTSWRASKLQKRSDAGSSNSSGPSTPVTTPAKLQNWPTLDEICARRIPQARDSDI